MQKSHIVTGLRKEGHNFIWRSVDKSVVSPFVVVKNIDFQTIRFKKNVP